nr:uncharacterized protein LOC126530763 [Dermacentor andersoni]XP_050039166.1 uncharacterized protein LOC126536286 isoform X2 [Dermacentor andersoni]
MSRVLHCGFKSVDGLDQHFRPSILRKGRRLFENNHVYGVREVDETDVSAKCLSQQSKHMYEVGLKLTMQPRKIESGVCTCRYGSMGNCKHCAAVAFYLNDFNHASCTSAPQTWGKPAGKPLLNDKASIGELFGGGTKKKDSESAALLGTQYFTLDGVQRKLRGPSCMRGHFLPRLRHMVFALSPWLGWSSSVNKVLKLWRWVCSSTPTSLGCVAAQMVYFVWLEKHTFSKSNVHTSANKMRCSTAQGRASLNTFRGLAVIRNLRSRTDITPKCKF